MWIYSTEIETMPRPMHGEKEEKRFHVSDIYLSIYEN